MKMTRIVVFLPFCFLMGCSPVGSEFSCNQTAGDSCLTIEQVDAMTHFADDPLLNKHPHRRKRKRAVSQKPLVYLSQNNDATGIWIQEK